MALIYELDIKESSSITDVDVSDFSDYQLDVVNTYLDNKEEIDQKIEDALVNWTMDSIAKVDLAILRLCITESFFVDEIPYKVAINEAVEIAKEYGDDKSQKFVNGIMRQCIDHSI